MGPISTGLGEIYQFEVKGEPACAIPARPTPTPVTRRWNCARSSTGSSTTSCARCPGSSRSNSFGGELKTYQVTLDPDALVAYGSPWVTCSTRVEANNRNVGGGYIAHQGEQYLIRGEGLVDHLEDIGNIVLSHNDAGTPVYVRNVADASSSRR